MSCLVSFCGPNRYLTPFLRFAIFEFLLYLVFLVRLSIKEKETNDGNIIIDLCALCCVGEKRLNIWSRCAKLVSAKNDSEQKYTVNCYETMQLKLLPLTAKLYYCAHKMRYIHDYTLYGTVVYCVYNAHNVW